MNIVMLALPWTVGLLTVAVTITWFLGNIAGGLAGYFQESAAQGLWHCGDQGSADPLNIVAFVFVIIFGFVWPVLPISGGFAMNVRQAWTWQFALSVIHYSILPASALVIVGIGTWFLGMRALVSNIVTEDYVTYASSEKARHGVQQGRIVGSYVIRNALVPQLTSLAMSLGGIFSGTVITEQVFTYRVSARCLFAPSTAAIRGWCSPFPAFQSCRSQAPSSSSIWSTR